jgi:hypothetical protein
MGVSLKTEARATKFAPEQQHGGEGNYQQRDQLLPIHGGKITPKSQRATRDLQHTVIFYWQRQNKIGGPFAENRLNPTPRHRVLPLNYGGLIVFSVPTDALKSLAGAALKRNRTLMPCLAWPRTPALYGRRDARPLQWLTGLPSLRKLTTFAPNVTRSTTKGAERISCELCVIGQNMESRANFEG